MMHQQLDCRSIFFDDDIYLTSPHGVREIFSLDEALGMGCALFRIRYVTVRRANGALLSLPISYQKSQYFRLSYIV